MVNILVAAAIALALSLLATPLLIRLLVSHRWGQFIRQDGPTAHYTKRGTPTMGGIVIIAATVAGYFGSNLVAGSHHPNASGLLVLFLMAGLGLIGFMDDSLKIRRQRSLGLRPIWKILGQGGVGIAFSLMAMGFPDPEGLRPASMRISFLRDTSIDLGFAGRTIGIVLFVLWANFLITAWSNAVNLTDGLDGLATGASAMVFGAYVIIGLWQMNQACAPTRAQVGCYAVRDPLDVAIAVAAIMGACLGFLWWNASPARIFMGDTGALALGGAYAGVSIVTRTEVLALIVGGLFFIIVMSDVIQIGWFKLTRGRRVFKMAPLHHHFELSGWGEVTIVIRFWLIAIGFVAVGVGLFYGESLQYLSE